MGVLPFFSTLLRFITSKGTELIRLLPENTQRFVESLREGLG